MFYFLRSKLIFLNTAFKKFQGSLKLSIHRSWFFFFSIKGYRRIRKGKARNGREGQQHDRWQWVHVSFRAGLRKRFPGGLCKVVPVRWCWRLCESSAAPLLCLPLRLHSRFCLRPQDGRREKLLKSVLRPPCIRTIMCAHAHLHARTHVSNIVYFYLFWERCVAQKWCLILKILSSFSINWGKIFSL